MGGPPACSSTSERPAPARSWHCTRAPRTRHSNCSLLRALHYRTLVSNVSPTVLTPLLPPHPLPSDFSGQWLLSRHCSYGGADKLRGQKAGQGQVRP